MDAPTPAGYPRSQCIFYALTFGLSLLWLLLAPSPAFATTPIASVKRSYLQPNAPHSRPTHADIGTAPAMLQVQDAAEVTIWQSFPATISAAPVITTGIVGRITAAGLGVAGVIVIVICNPMGEEICPAVEFGRDVTDAKGNFGFAHLSPINYLLLFDTPHGYTKLAPIAVTVVEGRVITLPEIILSSQLFLPILAP